MANLKRELAELRAEIIKLDESVVEVLGARAKVSQARITPPLTPGNTNFLGIPEVQRIMGWVVQKIGGTKCLIDVNSL